LAGWNSFKWLMWIALYLIPAALLPWAISRAWVHQHGKRVQFSPRQLFRRGELGLLSLILACSVTWDLLQSQFMPHTIALASIILAVCGIMSVTVWVETYCRQQCGSDWHPTRAWRDSRNLALMVFSVAAVMEVLLDRLAKAVSQ
jgi:hypothetical protein